MTTVLIVGACFVSFVFGAFVVSLIAINGESVARRDLYRVQARRQEGVATLRSAIRHLYWQGGSRNWAAIEILMGLEARLLAERAR